MRPRVWESTHARLIRRGPEIGLGQLRPVELAGAVQERRHQRKTLLAPQAIGRGQLVAAQARAPAEARRQRREGRMQLLVGQREVKRRAHLGRGQPARAGVGHREGRRDAVRGQEEVPGGPPEARVEIESERVVGGDEGADVGFPVRGNPARLLHRLGAGYSGAATATQARGAAAPEREEHEGGGTGRSGHFPHGDIPPAETLCPDATSVNARAQSPAPGTGRARAAVAMKRGPPARRPPEAAQWDCVSIGASGTFVRPPSPRARSTAPAGPRCATSSRSTRPPGCTTTSASRWKAFSGAGPCPRVRASTRRKSAWRSRSRTIRSSTAVSRARFPRASTEAARCSCGTAGAGSPRAATRWSNIERAISSSRSRARSCTEAGTWCASTGAEAKVQASRTGC